MTAGITRALMFGLAAAAAAGGAAMVRSLTLYRLKSTRPVARNERRDAQ